MVERAFHKQHFEAETGIHRTHLRDSSGSNALLLLEGKFE